jgi:hypothetical protein
VHALLNSARGHCLVCMPFADRFLPVYERIVAPAIAAAHLQPLRMDQVPTVGDIAEALRAEIGVARAVVAVIDEANPNVLYEVGFAHALDKPVLLLHGGAPDAAGTSGSAAAPGASLPFDIRTHRVVTYPRDFEAEATRRSVDELQTLLRAVTRWGPSV